MALKMYGIGLCLFKIRPLINQFKIDKRTISLSHIFGAKKITNEELDKSTKSKSVTFENDASFDNITNYEHLSSKPKSNYDISPMKTSTKSKKSNYKPKTTTIEKNLKEKKARSFSEGRLNLMTESYGSSDSKDDNIITNTTWTGAPGKINIQKLLEYPLFVTNKLDDEAFESDSNYIGEDVGLTRIGMFQGGYHRIPSVSKILKETMSESSKMVLEKWKNNMIAELGEQGFKKYSQSLLDRGQLFHECIEHEVTGNKIDGDEFPDIAKYWKSLKHVFPDISNVRVLESRLIHPDLHYQGIVDCIAEYRGMPVVVDWKTSKRAKSTLSATYDDPIQLAAYLGALQHDANYTKLPMVNDAILVVAYESGLPAHVHTISREKCGVFWNAWCQRLAAYWRGVNSPAT